MLLILCVSNPPRSPSGSYLPWVALPPSAEPMGKEALSPKGPEVDGTLSLKAV